MKCNLNPTNYINTNSTCNVECGRNTHTRTKPMAPNFTHTGKVIRVQRRKLKWVNEGRIKLYYGRKIYIFVIRCDAGGMVCCMMWNVHVLDGLQSVKWCRMMW